MNLRLHSEKLNEFPLYKKMFEGILMLRTQEANKILSPQYWLWLYIVDSRLTEEVKKKAMPWQTFKWSMHFSGLLVSLVSVVSWK